MMTQTWFKMLLRVLPFLDTKEPKVPKSWKAVKRRHCKNNFDGLKGMCIFPNEQELVGLEQK